VEAVRFYKTVDPFGCFSNFSRHPLFVSEKTWPTSEHYFQARKFPDDNVQQLIRKADSPMAAAQLGRSREYPLRTDWEAVKDEVMREVVRLKVRQHADVRETLLSTGHADIIEHTVNDSYWADGGDGSGKNMLGKILMEIREAWRANELSDKATHLPLPPWIRFPAYDDPSDLGYRMGGGQDYFEEWLSWFLGMTRTGRRRYNDVFPTRRDWERHMTGWMKQD
jgi:ribA/ribD-fused uncharacterized protein